MKIFELKELGLPVPYERLYYVGKLSTKRKVAIVGTRSATVEYCNFARKIGRELAMHGINVVSGFAFGIDIHAHLGCLDSKTEESVTVIMATPLDKVSPKDHQKYVPQIVAQNSFVGSVLACGREPTRQDFVLRNAVIAALSEIVIFVQGSIKSGAMHTVRFALDYGKEVFVVPGPPWDDNCSGTNSLIKEGCSVVTDASDILEALGISKNSDKKCDLSPVERAVISTIKSCKTCFVEDVISRTNFSISEIERALFSLEQKGLVEILFTDQILLKT